ncbi:ribonuclease P protein subunit p20 [Rhynchophorus ferrugineus]|uniref:Uncharacterized protein n=1 Tax=Rhynchophorus ferrugineus TaxID=354439 RepID=A0A834M9H1_RHYFE|nr:hypothetical protein GWI33_014007 [Rhynchophorus ferrugineus]
MAEKPSNRNHTNQQKPRRQDRKSSETHTFRKRRPEKPEIGKNIIYVNTKTSTKGLLEKCLKLIKNDEEEIVIYCLGAAIQRGILLALQITEKHISYQIDTNTFSTTLIDDLEPAVDDVDYEIQKRFNSALRIRVFKTDLLESAKKVQVSTGPLQAEATTE